jgi:hypothetical protein
MATKLILAAISGLLFAGHALAEISASPQKLNAILCNTEEQAMALAASVSAGRTEPMAIDGVNKAAGTQVCGRYIGYAVVEIEKTENRDERCSCLPGCGLPRTAGSPGRPAGSPPSTRRASRAEPSDLLCRRARMHLANALSWVVVPEAWRPI